MQACTNRFNVRKQRRSALNSTTTEIDFDAAENNSSYEELLNSLSTEIHEHVNQQLSSFGWVWFL